MSRLVGVGETPTPRREDGRTTAGRKARYGNRKAGARRWGEAAGRRRRLASPVALFLRGLFQGHGDDVRAFAEGADFLLLFKFGAFFVGHISSYPRWQSENGFAFAAGV